MSLIGRKEAKYWHNLLMRVWITALTVAIIVWFLPRDSNSKRYNYDVGKPWMYQSFIAQFDFPIYKSEDAIKQDQAYLSACNAADFEDLIFITTTLHAKKRNWRDSTKIFPLS